jgi:hypothetical protein
MLHSIHRLSESVLFFCALFLATVTPLRADEPTEPEMLPPPRESEPRKVLPERPYWPPPYFRTSRYEVWQYYGVDRLGRFRPRVVYSPYGSYYLYNGQPYPWMTTHARDFMPYVMD